MTTEDKTKSDDKKTSTHWNTRTSEEEKREANPTSNTNPSEPSEPGTQESDAASAGARFNKVLQGARGTLERGFEEITKISKVGKLKFDITKLQRERDSLLRKLGRDTYQMLKDGSFDKAEVEKYVARLDQLFEDIQNHNTQVDETTGRIQIPTDPDEK